ncbi:MAG: hypothetical protein ACOH1Y_13935 [Propionicimonas sp.]
MWTRLVSAIAALAAVFSVWWVAQHDEARSMGELAVLVVANPPSGSADDSASGVPGSLGHDACTGISAALSPSEVEWSSATQPNGVRACRWIKSWRVADLARQSSPGEPRVVVHDGTISVTLDPLPSEQGVGITTFEVTMTFPGEILSFSGAGAVAGSTVVWSNPAGFFSGVELSASGRDRPLLIGLLPWLAGVFAVIALVGALPWTRADRARGPDAAAEDTHRKESPPLGASVPGPMRAGRHDGAPPMLPTTAAVPKGHDPTSPWRPPSPQ